MATEKQALNAYIEALYELHRGAKDGHNAEFTLGKLDAIGTLHNFTWGREEKKAAHTDKYSNWEYSIYKRDTEEKITSRLYPWTPATLPTR